MKMAWVCNSDKDTKKLICSYYISENTDGFLKEGDECGKGRGIQQVITQPCSLLVSVRKALKLDI